MSVDFRKAEDLSTSRDRLNLSDGPCISRLYWRNGNLKYIGFVDNIIDKNKNGRGKYFDVHGNLYFVGNFKNNKFDGPKNTYYYTNRMIRFKGESSNGNFKKGIEFHKNGKFKYRGSFESVKPKFNVFNIEYHSNGQILKIGCENKLNSIDDTNTESNTEPNFEGAEFDNKGYKKGENPQAQTILQRNQRIVWMINIIRNRQNANA